MTRTIDKVVVKSFITEGEEFVICKDNEGEFWGFNANDIDENGRTKKEYNGITGSHGETIIETMRSCYRAARTKNEINRELLNQNDMNELKKLMQIVDDSFNVIA